MYSTHNRRIARGFLGGLIRRFRERREMNRLLSLDDHLLHDIGISRSDIQRQSMRSLWHD
jgi:uncharacterized protein YjiS (DUF1127 family)